MSSSPYIYPGRLYINKFKRNPEECYLHSEDPGISVNKDYHKILHNGIVKSRHMQVDSTLTSRRAQSPCDYPVLYPRSQAICETNAASRAGAAAVVMTSLARPGKQRRCCLEALCETLAPAREQGDSWWLRLAMQALRVATVQTCAGSELEAANGAVSYLCGWRCLRCEQKIEEKECGKDFDINRNTKHRPLWANPTRIQD